MGDDKRDLTDDDLERIDRNAAEDLVSRHSKIGLVARARTIRRLVSALRRVRSGRPTENQVGIERAIAGAVRSAIDAHGPITRAHIGSTVKRVVGSLRNL